MDRDGLRNRTTQIEVRPYLSKIHVKDQRRLPPELSYFGLLPKYENTVGRTRELLSSQVHFDF